MAEVPFQSNQFSIKLALVFGGVQIGYQALSLFFGADYIVSLTHFTVLMTLFFGLPVVFGYIYQKEAQTQTFRDLFFGIFRIVAAGVLLNMSFEIAMMNSLFNGIQYEMFDVAMAKGSELLARAEAPDSEIELFVAQLEQLKEQIPDKYSLISLFSNYVTSLGLWILPVALATLVFKNRTPQAS